MREEKAVKKKGRKMKEWRRVDKTGKRREIVDRRATRDDVEIKKGNVGKE